MGDDRSGVTRMWAVFGVRAQFFPQNGDVPAHMLSVTSQRHAVQHAENLGKRDVGTPFLLGHDTPDAHDRVDLYSVGVSDA
ncbi:hypothetical protein GCM10010532_094620 [Dactylosporangium siamense]|uniref:Uncharacterized protein n=1 Tax=Dactylosporangium siamense TaxID=685454 RepID=A0A919UCI6_9ACTN|nr:hypothetical protein Dsi01nite_084680 [Dactylosporangium siamense]